MNSSSLVQVIRWLDGVWYSIIILLVFLFHPTVGFDELGHPQIIWAIPLVVISLLAFRLPIKLGRIKNWSKSVIRLRFFSLSFSCLFPFLLWCYTTPESLYFLINSQLAIISGIGFLIYLNAVIQELGSYSKNRFIILGSGMTRHLLFYTLFVPFLTFIIVYFVDSYISIPKSYTDFYTIVILSPPWLQLLFFFPIGACFIQFWAMRTIFFKILSASEYESD